MSNFKSFKSTHLWKMDEKLTKIKTIIFLFYLFFYTLYRLKITKFLSKWRRPVFLNKEFRSMIQFVYHIKDFGRVLN